MKRASLAALVAIFLVGCGEDKGAHFAQCRLDAIDHRDQTRLVICMRAKGYEYRPDKLSCRPDLYDCYVKMTSMRRVLDWVGL